LQSVLSKSQFQQEKFNEYYYEFKEQLKKATDSKVKELPKEQEKPEKKTKEAQFEALKDWLNLSPSEEEKEISAYSGLNVLTQKDFHATDDACFTENGPKIGASEKPFAKKIQKTSTYWFKRDYSWKYEKRRWNTTARFLWKEES